MLREHRLEAAGPAVANFLFVRVGDADALNDALLRQGVIVRPMGSFGAPDALRISAGTPEEVAFLAGPLAPSISPSPLEVDSRYVFVELRRDRGREAQNHGLTLGYPPPAGARRGARLL